VVGGLLLGHQSSHQRAHQLIAAPGVDRPRHTAAPRRNQFCAAASGVSLARSASRPSSASTLIVPRLRMEASTPAAASL
jgi:hypothetical protein